MTNTTNNFSDAAGAATQDHLYVSGYSPLYSFLVFLQNDLEKDKLLSDNEYCEEFKNSFNTVELWANPSYTKIAEEIVDSIPINYTQTIKCLNNYGLIATVHNLGFEFNDSCSAIDKFNSSVDTQELLSVSKCIDDLTYAVNQDEVDSILFKLVRNSPKISINDRQDFINLLVKFEKSYKTGYYLSIIDNVIENGCIFSKGFIKTYLGKYLAKSYAVIQNYNYNISQYYNCINRMTDSECSKGIHELFESIIIKSKTKILEVNRISLITLKQFYIKLGLVNDVKTINDVLSEIECTDLIYNLNTITVNLKKDILPINTSAISESLSKINDTLFTNQSATEVNNVRSVIEYSKYDELDGLAGSIGTTMTAVTNSITPEAMNAKSSNYIISSIQNLQTVSKDKKSIFESTSDMYSIISNTLSEKLGFINSSIANLMDMIDPQKFLSPIQDFFNSIMNLRVDLNIFNKFLNKQICALKNLLCAIGKILGVLDTIKEIANMIDDTIDKIKKAKSAADEITKSIEETYKTTTMTDISSKVSSAISDKIMSAADKVIASIGESLGQEAVACMIKSAKTVTAGLSEDNNIKGQLSNFASSASSAAFKWASENINDPKCRSAMNLPGIGGSLPTFSGLSFNLPSFTIQPLNCK